MMELDIVSKIIIGIIIMFFGDYIRTLRKDLKFAIQQNETIMSKLDILSKDFNILYGEHRRNHQ